MTTAGEGGMVNTSRPELWDVMWSFKDHGKTHEAVFGREHPPGCWLHERFGSTFASLAAELNRTDPAPAPSGVDRNSHAECSLTRGGTEQFVGRTSASAARVLIPRLVQVLCLRAARGTGR